MTALMEAASPPCLRRSNDQARQVRVYQGRDLPRRLEHWRAFARRHAHRSLSRHPEWLLVLRDAFQHLPLALEATAGDRTVGFLPLAFTRSLLFGKFLVSLPYLNVGGVIADDADAARLLIDRAAGLAADLGARYLELRHEEPIDHPALSARRTDKVHMRLPLPEAAEVLWKKLAAKVRNQVRKGQKSGLAVAWGGGDQLGAFYDVFSRNMRDLGTPVYGKVLFSSILDHFPGQAELCVVRAGRKPVAAALLLHGEGVTEVPSASSLRAYNATCANMLLYWSLLERAVARRQAVFDFGRSTVDGNTFKFKKQWGAEPAAAVWQYHDRTGSVGTMRPDHPKYDRFIRLWQRLPVSLTRWIGPAIVRGIP